MLKKIAAAAALAGALAFSAVAPAVVSAGSIDGGTDRVVEAKTGIWPDPMSTKGKKDTSTNTGDTTYTTYSTGIWPDPM